MPKKAAFGAGMSVANGYPRIPFKADVFNGRAARACVAPWRWLMPLLACAISVLSGCANPPAPSPTPNPNPQQTLKLKITVEDGSEVNRVEVQSNWVVTRLDCAPLVYPEGYNHVKQVDVEEKVDKVGGYYIATLVMDRFLPDKCQWTNGGPDVKFFHDSQLLGLYGVNDDVMRDGIRHESSCAPSSDKIHPPICFSRKQEAFLRSHFKGVFNVTVELML